MPVWQPKQPCVYIMASKPNSVLYIGVTSDLAQRVSSHKKDLREGFTKQYQVHMLIYYELHKTFDEAFSRETRLKKWQRAWKVRLIQEMNPEWVDLFNIESGAILRGPADLARLLK